MGVIRKTSESKSVSPIDPTVMKAWNMGATSGARQQRTSDIKQLVKILEDLEEIPGIGEKTAWKIRELFLSKLEE